MKYLCIVTVLLLLSIPLLAQTEPRQLTPDLIDSLNIRENKLTENILQHVERTHGPGAGVGADGPWIMERKILEKTFLCISQTPAAQTGVIFGCLEPLRLLYEDERATRVSSVKAMADTLATIDFLTLDHQKISLFSFLKQNIPNIMEDENIKEELSQKLRWEQKNRDRDKDTTALRFTNLMTIWKQHLVEDSKRTDDL